MHFKSPPKPNLPLNLDSAFSGNLQQEKKKRKNQLDERKKPLQHSISNNNNNSNTPQILNIDYPIIRYFSQSIKINYQIRLSTSYEKTNKIKSKNQLLTPLAIYTPSMT